MAFLERAKLTVLAAAFSFFVPLAVYLFTLAPWLFWRDSSEFSMVAYLLDIAHPPGSPAYVLLGKAVSFLPIGNIAFRSNALSALMGAVLSLLVFFLILAMARLLFDLKTSELWSRPLVLATAAATALAVSLMPANWYWAVVAEVYTLNLAFTLACLYLAVRCLGEKKDNGEKTDAWLPMLGLVAGLGAGVHPNMILFLPGLFCFAIYAAIKNGGVRSFAFWLLFLMLGLSVYLLLPIRSSTPIIYDYGNPETVRQLLDHLTARSYSERVYHYPLSRAFAHWGQVPWMIVHQLGWPALVLGIVGLVSMFRRKMSLALLLLVLGAGNLWLVKDWTAQFGYLPVFLVWAVYAGTGVLETGTFVLRRLDRQNISLAGRGFTVVLFLGVVLVGLVQAQSGWEAADKSGNWLAGRHGKAVLEVMPQEAALVSSVDHISYLANYLQNVENTRNDVAHIHQAFLSYPSELAKRWPEMIWAETLFDETQPLAPLMAQMDRHPLFYDRSHRNESFLPARQVLPYGIVYRILPDLRSPPGPEILGPHFALMEKWFAPIWSDPWFNEYDWTARQVYAHIADGQGKYYSLNGKLALAEMTFKQAIRLAPEYDFGFQNLGALYMGMYDYEKTELILTEGLHLHPESAGLLASRGLLEEKAGVPGKAAAYYSIALNYDPYNDTVRLSLANQLVRIGHEDEAIGHYQRLWEDGGLPVIRAEAGVNLAVLRAKRGDTDEARKMAHRILSYNPGYEPALELLEKLQSENGSVQ